MGLGLKKNRESHNPVWPGWPSRLTWKNPVKNLDVTRWLFFCFFFIKTILFWFIKKNRVDPGDPGKTRYLGLDRVDHQVGFQNSEERSYSSCFRERERERGKPRKIVVALWRIFLKILSILKNITIASI
jgi:hypothetical protein